LGEAVPPRYALVARILIVYPVFSGDQLSGGREAGFISDPDTRRNVISTLEFEPAGALGWRVKAVEAVEALSASDRPWREELYRRNRDAHVDGIGNEGNPEDLFAAVGSVATRLGGARSLLEGPISPSGSGLGMSWPQFSG